MIVSVGLTHWTTAARIVRSEVLSLRGRPYIDAAIGGGAGRMRVIRRHLRARAHPAPRRSPPR